MMRRGAASEGALGLKRGRESVRSEVSPLDGEWCVVGGCVGVEKGGRCADKAGVLLMTVSAPSRGAAPCLRGQQRRGGRSARRGKSS